MTIQQSTELAVLGGTPAFEAPLHVGRPNMGDRARFMERVEDLLDRHWLTNDGPYVHQLEEHIAKLIGVKECVATCNGTIALEILTRALDMQGEVIVPSFTFVATAHALQWQEIKPVFADVDPDHYTLDPARVEALITPRTTGIIGVHLWGQPCDTDGLQEVADRHDLPLVYDAAHAFGCSHKGKMIGSFGRAEAFSFHATKAVHCFEGGAIVTDDSELAKRMRLMRNFGFDGPDRVIYVGSNGKLSEIHAAMGLTTIEALDEITDRNKRNYIAYSKHLAGLPGVELIPHPKGGLFNHHYVILRVDAERAGLTRDELSAALQPENVLARRYFHPGVHHMEPYASLQPMAHLVLPVTEALSQEVLAMPTGQQLDEVGVEKLCGVIRRVLDRAPAVRAALATKDA